MDNLSGKWTGSYTFDPEFSEDNTENKFELTLTVDDDDLTGEVIDITDDEKPPVRAKIEGFMDEDEISFIKKYPSLVLKNELNETLVDKEKEHPDIHYHGTIQENYIEGTWDMELGVVLQAGQYYSQMITGTWKMEKAN